ncbi:glycerophosphodiester phosphodiesterase [Halogeometricum pallidum JCM 14848]|uniref:Glycerophosphodiester phosphodiesterase n=1 Tax=Halogeometricum pallidum JCM 14848 TaxID=1227487 RepID=M0DB45_HALPD|nr:glycerophosphodiester phosphodiesterase [Halogeometricum pallidum]ELZ31399.1 glycerophosphodiester phosphodiesterase [Halogeometricum pallidum JCM 14848]
MRLIAHRGFDGQYSANTVAAVEQAVPHADMIEIDVRGCASGELVVVHDPLVDIAVDGVTSIDDLTATELSGLDVHDGEGVQTLRAVLDAIPPDTGVNLELKDPNTVERALEVARSVEHEVIVSSFDADAIRRVHADDDAGVELAYVLGLRPGDDLGVANDLECAYVHPNAWLCLLTDVVENAHRAGMTVNAWTVDSRLGAWALQRRGVDGVIASSPHVTEWVE